MTERTTTLNLLLGFTLALSTSLRINNLLLFPVIAGGVLVFEAKQLGMKRMLESAFEIAIGALPLALIQLFFNSEQYGSFFATGYNAHPIDDFGKHLRSTINFYQLLVHPVAGAFVWSPVTFISFAGLLAGALQRKPVPLLFLTAVCVVIFSISFGWIVWPGSSFGQRLLTHLCIFWVVGLYEAFLYFKRPVMIGSAVAVLWSFMLFNLYYINFAFPESRKSLAADTKSVTPASVVSAAYLNYSSFRDSCKGGWFALWFTSLQARTYPDFQFILRNPEHIKPQREKR